MGAKPQAALSGVMDVGGAERSSLRTFGQPGSCSSVAESSCSSQMHMPVGTSMRAEMPASIMEWNTNVANREVISVVYRGRKNLTTRHFRALKENVFAHHHQVPGVRR